MGERHRCERLVRAGLFSEVGDVRPQALMGSPTEPEAIEERGDV